MRTNIKAWITSDDRKWVVAACAFELGEDWTIQAEGPPDSVDPGNYTNTAHHIGMFLSGSYDVKYPAHGKVSLVGPCYGSGRLITGDKHRYPKGSLKITCTAPGEILFVVPKSAVQPDLDYKLLFPGESTTIPSAGWRVVLEGGAYTATEVTGLVNAASAVSPTLVFWEK